MGRPGQCSHDFPGVTETRLQSKKKTDGYRERDDHQRAAFLKQLAQIPVADRVYLDESGMDEREDYGYGWCKPGVRFEALKSGGRRGRVNMIAAYCEHQLNAAFTVELEFGLTQ